MAEQEEKLKKAFDALGAVINERLAAPPQTMESRLAGALTKLQERFGDDALVKALEIAAAIANVLPAEASLRD